MPLRKKINLLIALSQHTNFLNKVLKLSNESIIADCISHKDCKFGKSISSVTEEDLEDEDENVREAWRKILLKHQEFHENACFFLTSDEKKEFETKLYQSTNELVQLLLSLDKPA